MKYMLLGLLVSQIATAKVDIKKSAPLQLPEEIQYTDSTNQVIGAIAPPTYLAGQTGDVVALHLADNSLKYLWNNTGLKNTAAGQIAKRVEDTVQVEAKVSSGDEVKEKKTEHKFNFDIKGLQALAQLKYSGWVNAAVHYSIKSAEASAELSERVFTDKDLVMSQVISSTNPRSQISLRWDW